MSERRAQDREPGWLSTAGGALLLVVVGFAVGLVAGTAFEEPALVLDQLAGRGERIAVDPVDGVEEVELSRSRRIPPVAAETPETEAPDDTGFVRPSVDAGPPLERRTPLPGSGFAIQVGAFDDASAARALASWLRQKGHPGFVVEAASSPWRVRVGPYESKAEAQRVSSRLQAEHELPTWVLPVGGS